MKKLKNQLFIVLLCTILLSVNSCKKDNKEEDQENTPAYNFLNQTAAGKINAVPWTFIGGTARQDYFEQSKMRIQMYSDTAYCFGAPFTDGVIVTLPKSTGLYLFTSSQTGTIYQYPGTNLGVYEKGAIEILTYDTVQGIVTGRIDIKYDNDNYVNGNFSLIYCN